MSIVVLFLSIYSLYMCGICPGQQQQQQRNGGESKSKSSNGKSIDLFSINILTLSFDAKCGGKPNKYKLFKLS